MPVRELAEPHAQPEQLKRVLQPGCVAIIGASEDPSKRGYQAIGSLQSSGFTGPVYPVNPKGGFAKGLNFLTAIADLPSGVDVAVIAVPAAAVPGVLNDLADVEVAGAVVLADGFTSTTETGRRLSAEVQEISRTRGVRVVGPNTSGIAHVASGANLVGLPNIPSGPVSIVTQSGNMFLSVVADGQAANAPGIHSYIGLGNQLDLRYAECISALAADPSVKSIAVHCEGLPNGREFLTAAAQASVSTPIVMLQGGHSTAGQQTTLSHTGSISAPADVSAGVLRQAGVELVHRSDELAIVAGALATARPIDPNRHTVILSDGGGHAALAADAMDMRGLALASVNAATRDKLRELLGEGAALANPIDVAGATDANPMLLAECAEVLAKDPHVGAIQVIGLYGGYHVRFDSRLQDEELRTSERLVRLAQTAELPIMVQSCYAHQSLDNHQILCRGGIPVLSSIDQSVRVLGALSQRGIWLDTQEERSNLQTHNTTTSDDLSEARLIDEARGRELLSRAGLAIAPWVLATSAAEAADAVNSFDAPCALKVVSADVAHKSDIGGVKLHVQGSDASQAWDAIMAAVKSRCPGADVRGVLVTPVIRSSFEFLVGARRDPIFGPIVTFGAGGVLVEISKDVAFRAAPLTHREAHEMIDETVIGNVLDGYRGLIEVSKSAMADFLVSIGQLLMTETQIVELDLNPIVTAGDKILPLDVRVISTS